VDSPENFTAPVHVHSFSFVSFAELAPVLDELNKRHNTVEAAVYDFEPPAAGFSEIAITIATDASAAILATLALQGGGNLLGKLRRLMNHAKKNPYGRHYVPLRVQIGRVRFYFHEVVSEEALLERLRAAHEFSLSLPPEAFLGEAGPGEIGMYWDDKSKAWRGGINGFRDEYCYPENMLSGDPGDVICIE
jgi:hypothetical protein